MKKVKLYPTRRGLIVRDPRTHKPLAENGEDKEKTGYWLRRLRDGSVSETPLPAEKVDKADVTKPARKVTETEK